MANIKPFEEHADIYEQWFEENKYVYLSEIEAIKSIIPIFDNGLEIGAGSGRFGQPLGIKTGIEPSSKMAFLAKKRGMNIVEGIGELLPFDNNKFDMELMVTSICFVDNVQKVLRELYRTLIKGGSIIIGFIDKKSPIGKLYLKYKNDNLFYRYATFYSTFELIKYLKECGFNEFSIVQTIFNDLNNIKSIEQVEKGYGKGSFIVIRAIK